jgi:hypothetical protein
LATACFLILPLTILLDEALYRVFGEEFAKQNVLLTLGYHIINLQSVVGIIFYFIGILILLTEAEPSK